MANPLVRVVYITHALLNARTSLFVVVCAMLFIGIQKARGKMPHPASRAIGRGEFIGAMFMVMPDSYMQGFGQIAGAGVILVVMGAMVAIKPKAFVTEAFFIANASKVLAANWGAVLQNTLLFAAQFLVFSGLFPDQLAGILLVICYITVLYYGFLVVRAGLQCDVIMAIGLVVLKTLVVIGISIGFRQLA